jgi:hypothetical protein
MFAAWNGASLNEDTPPRTSGQAGRGLRIQNSAGATGRVARRTRLGDDGNQIGAHSALRTLHSALERLFSGIHFGLDERGNGTT